MPKRGWQHGIITGYRNKGCRCFACTAAHNVHQLEYLHGKKASDGKR
jgi:hypothetical protein